MSKHNIMIDEELFFNLCNYFLINPESQELFDACIIGISSKYEKVVNRELYTTMHNPNLTDAEKEAARQEYLDRRGIPDGFRWGAGQKGDNVH